MAGIWVHKEANWELEHEYNYSSPDQRSYCTILNTDRNEEGYTFTQWLDVQCEDGWEVLKISRNFINEKNTWVVFRKKI